LATLAQVPRVNTCLINSNLS